MLSGETAIGKFPIETVRTMSTIARKTEAAAFDGTWRLHRHRQKGLPGSPARLACINAAVYAAHQAEARIILAFTESGRTARLVSSFRASQPIVALTQNERAFRRMALYWGVLPGRLKPVKRVREMSREAGKLLRKHRLLSDTDRVVTLTGTFQMSGATNTVRILELQQLG
jgi:pyruvate kinase